MFLTSTYILCPANPADPSQAGNKFVTYETFSFVKNLRDSDLKQANVILDVIKLSVVKCRDFKINGNVVVDPDYKTLWDHFYSVNPTELDMILKAINTPQE